MKAEEGELSDDQWSAIATDFVREMGFVDEEGERSCRWVAIRHGLSTAGNDHVHIAVNLVREDGTKADTHRDYVRAQKIAGELEVKYGLDVLRADSRTPEPSARTSRQRPHEPRAKARRTRSATSCADACARSQRTRTPRKNSSPPHAMPA